MDSILNNLGVIVSILATLIIATWHIASIKSMSREDVYKIVDKLSSDFTGRLDRLIERLENLAVNSVPRSEFHEETLTLRKKITEHISNVNIHSGHGE